MLDVDALFLQELANRGVTATRDEEGNYTIERDGGTLSISLFNLRRDVERDGGPGRVSNFVDTILSVLKTPTWDEAKPWVRWQLEPVDSPISDALHEVVSDQLAIVLVLASEDESQIRWISPSTAQEWGQTKDSLFAVAGDNMAAIAAKIEITVETIDEYQLGMIGTDWLAYKAALLFSRGFQPKAEPLLGWPLYAVMPCRDFVYLVPEKDKALLPRLGAVVVKEYRKGAYPLSTEVFELTDQSIRATFEFQKPPAGDPDAPHDPSWRIVQYGGFLRFRLPIHWTDSPVQKGTEYFDPNGLGRLLSLVVGKQTDTPISVDDGRIEAENLASASGASVTPRDPVSWLVESPASVLDDLTIWGWMLVAAVPPNQIHIASFKYYVTTALLNEQPERVEAERSMVRQEILTAFFQPKPIEPSPPEEKRQQKPSNSRKIKPEKGDKN